MSPHLFTQCIPISSARWLFLGWQLTKIHNSYMKTCCAGPLWTCVESICKFLFRFWTKTIKNNCFLSSAVPGGLPTSSRKKNLGLPLAQQQIHRTEPETEKKLRQIIKRHGILTINGVEYHTDIKDLEDLGELGNGTCGHVVKMRHTQTNTIIAVKVCNNFSFKLHAKFANLLCVLQQMRRTGNMEENKRIITDLDVVNKCDCPYIVHCLGCFITEADVWICMELMATCFDKLTKKSLQPVPEPILGKVTVAVSQTCNWTFLN